MFNECCSLLPADLRQALQGYIQAEELHLRCGYAPTVLICGKELAIKNRVISEADIHHVLEVATGASVHSAVSFLQSGYLEYKGLRIGVCGQALYRDGTLEGFRRYTSLTIRIPKQCHDVLPREICKTLLERPGSTIVAGSPGVGKTTALREIIRFFSNSSRRVSVADERGELGCFGEYDLGKCTDVMSFVPKAEAAILLLRAMNPEIIVMDEISKVDDAAAIFDVLGCGVHIITSLHGVNLKDVLNRPVYKQIIESGLFDYFITISLQQGKREYKLERIIQ